MIYKHTFCLFFDREFWAHEEDWRLLCHRGGGYKSESNRGHGNTDHWTQIHPLLYQSTVYTTQICVYLSTQLFVFFLPVFSLSPVT